MRNGWVLLMGIGGLLAAAAGAAGSQEPLAVSPGDSTRLVLIADSCPTFSWVAVDGAQSYELVVYRIGAQSEEAEPVFTRRIAGSALSWTPSLDRCLERGGHYAWSVRAIKVEQVSEWSPPSLFQVAAGPNEAEFEAAMTVVWRYLAIEDGDQAAVGAVAPRRQHAGIGDSPARSLSASRSPAAPLTSLALSLDDNLKITTGDTPVLRLAQDASLGSEVALWDLTANEAGVSIEDASHSTSPFTIESGAPSDSLVVEATGNVKTLSVSGDGSALTGVTATDLVGAACVSEAELDFDPATQAEMSAHALLPAVHHTPTVDTTCHGVACDGADFTNLQWSNLTGLPTTTKGDLLVENGADIVRLGAGTDGQVLMADSSQSHGMRWARVGDSCPICSGPALVPRTGQTTSYAVGDDGDLERGVVWPNPRFTDNGNGTVTDNLTGLIWLQDADCFGKRSWLAALNDASLLASGEGCDLTDDSVAGDWRLPNRFELESLLDLEFFTPALSNAAGTGHWIPGDPFSNVMSAGYYWSSTTSSKLPAYASIVDLDDGATGTSDKGSINHVWLVRG